MGIACDIKGRGQPRAIAQLAPASSNSPQKYAFIMETRS